MASIIDFYRTHAFDPEGGFHHCLRDDGSVCAPGPRHLVSSTRFVYLFSNGVRVLGDDSLRPLVRHALTYLTHRHYRPDTDTFRWELSPDDNTAYAYGLAFVLLAGSAAVAAGEEDGRWAIERAVAILERDFWEPDAGLYADERGADGHELAPYRGQNANMHLCEAHIAAAEATGESAYLDRALRIAEAITRRLPATTDGRIWEHYHADWSVDWEFHRDQPDDLFRPWGFQPGHHAEWSKLLLQLNARRPQEWLVPRARELFEIAVSAGWDSEYGGLYYGFAPDGSITSSDKYYWVQTEAIGAAALLHRETGESQYREWYTRLWEYSWQHLIDHRHGGWYRILDRQNRPYSDLKSPPGKAGYHPVGACVAALEAYSPASPQD